MRALTVRDRFNFLSRKPELDEVYFWQARAIDRPRSLGAGRAILFKLLNPNKLIVGGGFFTYWTRLPLSRVGCPLVKKNGAPTFQR